MIRLKNGSLNFKSIWKKNYLNAASIPYDSCCWCINGLLLSTMYDSLVTSSLITETIENESINNGFNFNQWVVDFQGRVINTLANIININRADLSIRIMHKRNAYNFSLDLVSDEVLPVALTVPAVNG